MSVIIREMGQVKQEGWGRLVCTEFILLYVQNLLQSYLSVFSSLGDENVSCERGPFIISMSCSGSFWSN